MFDELTKQITDTYRPEKILLFGSQAKGSANNKSDIDICIVIDTDNKRQLLSSMYYSLEVDKPIDILLYTKYEWQECIKDKTSFAYKINLEGVKLYG